MRLGIIFLLLAATGCKGKHEANSAQEFFDKYVKAAQARNVETLWLMYSTTSHTNWISMARAELERAKAVPSGVKVLQETYELPADPAAITPEILAKARWKKDRKKMLENAGVARLLDERPEGDRIIVTVEWPPAGRLEWVLVREKKYLRLDDIATDMRNRPH